MAYLTKRAVPANRIAPVRIGGVNADVLFATVDGG